MYWRTPGDDAMSFPPVPDGSARPSGQGFVMKPDDSDATGGSARSP